ncbi:histidine--tRNA ligase [Candidatus Woesearchaeota archaeon]|nr:histidine--tRNA ligase [Candidatus Woesearchaeota archaeon]
METVKGFNDYTGEEAIKRQKVKEVLIKYFSLYGFEPAETPVIEYEEFVKGNNSEDEAVSDIFKLNDKGKRKLALRYEFTFQLKRIAKDKKLPYKRFQISEVFRDEPVSSNRFRQFTQCDIDIIGSSIKEEAEILILTYNALKELNIDPIININNRKLLNEILEKEGIKNKEEVIREIDKLDKLSKQEIKNNLKKFKAEKVLDIFNEKETYFEKYDSYKEIKELKKYCSNYGIKINFQPYLARGLSYYNGTIFEVKSSKMKETICAGGSYLVNNIQSTGISFGLDRLNKLAELKTKENNVLIVALSEDKKVFEIAEELRKNNINCSLIFGKPSKALDYANSKKINYVLFIGEKELKLKKLKLKNMDSGKEEMLTLVQLTKKFSS